MSPARKDAMKRWGPPLATIAASVLTAVLGAWIVMASRVSALEARVDEKRDAIAQIQQDVREVRQQVSEIYRLFIGNHSPH